MLEVAVGATLRCKITIRLQPPKGVLQLMLTNLLGYIFILRIPRHSLHSSWQTAISVIVSEILARNGLSQSAKAGEVWHPLFLSSLPLKFYLSATSSLRKHSSGTTLYSFSIKPFTISYNRISKYFP